MSESSLRDKHGVPTPRTDAHFGVLSTGRQVRGTEDDRNFASQLERELAEKQKTIDGWVAANAPGGWIDDLRTKRSALANSVCNEMDGRGEGDEGPVVTDDVRAALLFALWHHQGGSSRIGQPLRLMLGVGSAEPLRADQIAEAKRVESALAPSAIRDNLERAERVLKAWAGWNGPMVEDDAFTMQEQAKKYFALKNEAPQESLAGPVRGDGSVEQGTAVASPRRFQGGLSNDELRAAWGAKVPSVQPTEAELTAFALGIEVGDSLPAELPSATQPNPAPPEYRHTYAARTGWTPEQWDKVWREHAEEHERLAHHARSEIGRLNGVDRGTKK